MYTPKHYRILLNLKDNLVAQSSICLKICNRYTTLGKDKLAFYGKKLVCTMGKWAIQLCGGMLLIAFSHLNLLGFNVQNLLGLTISTLLATKFEIVWLTTP